MILIYRELTPDWALFDGAALDIWNQTGEHPTTFILDINIVWTLREMKNPDIMKIRKLLKLFCEMTGSRVGVSIFGYEGLLYRKAYFTVSGEYDEVVLE